MKTNEHVDFFMVEDCDTHKKAIIPYRKIDIVTEEIDEDKLIEETVNKGNTEYIPEKFTQIKLTDGKIYRVNQPIENVWATLFKGR